MKYNNLQQKQDEEKTLREIRKIFDDARDLVVSKSRNYGVGKIFEPPRLAPNATAETAILTRLSDKIGRFETLLRGERDRVGESLDDTARDMIGYLALWLTLRQIEADKSNENVEDYRRRVAAQAEFEAAVQYP